MKNTRFPLMIFLNLLFIATISYAQKAPEFRLIRILPEKSAGTNEDGFELYRPTIVAYNNLNDLLYISDSGNHRIVLLNTDLEFVDEFGSFGQGPGEFDNPREISFNRTNSTFIYDAVNMRINIFDSSHNFMKSFRLPISITPYFKILLATDSKSRLFLNLPRLGNLITVLNIDGKVTDGIEAINKEIKSIKDRFAGRCLGVIDENDYLYCVYTDQTILRKYNIVTKNIVNETSYEFIPWIKERTEKTNDYFRKTGRFEGYQYAMDISHDKNNLFLRFTVINPDLGNQQRVYIFDKDLNVKPDVLSLKVQYLTGIEFNHPDYIFTLDNVSCVIHRFNKKEVVCLKN